MNNNNGGGRIYRIFSESASIQYIGSTTLLLAKRFESHCDSYNAWQQSKTNFLASFIILKHDDAAIELIEECQCSDEKYLHKREQHWIDTLPCVNLANACYAQAGSHRVYRCETCAFVTCMQTKYNSHVLHNKCFGAKKKTTQAVAHVVQVAPKTEEVGDGASRSTGVLYTCSRCNYQTNKKCNFDKHANRVTQCGPKETTVNFKCKKCGYCVMTMRGLTRHLAVCDGNDPLKCQHCGTTFTTRIAKNRHCTYVNCRQLDN
jgi:hypothetical protein